VDIDELQDLIAKIQKMFSADNEKQFLLETEIDRISEKYSAEKDKNDPLVILQKTPKADRAKSCVFRGIGPPIPTTCAHLYRGMGPALTCCLKA
jgi:hypothetical protein